MINWKMRLEKAYEKLREKQVEKLQAGRAAKQQIDSFYEEFFKKKVTSAFEMVKRALADKYRVELDIPKEQEYDYYHVSASLTIFTENEPDSARC